MTSLHLISLCIIDHMLSTTGNALKSKAKKGQIHIYGADCLVSISRKSIASAHPWLARFVADGNSFILGLLCYSWLSFCSDESSLHWVFIWFVLLLFAFVSSLDCFYLCFHLPCTFDGWVLILDFYLHGFKNIYIYIKLIHFHPCSYRFPLV